MEVMSPGLTLAPQTTTARAGGIGRGRDALLAAVLVTACVALCFRAFDPQKTDFRMFYSAAQMLRHGAAHQLYDLDVQHAFQLRYAKRTGLIYDYPPASLLLYLPGAWLSLSRAYLLWTLLSTAMLLASSVLLNRRLRLFPRSVLFFASAFLFLPIWLNLMHGQIVFCVLLAYAIAFYYFAEGRELAAGCALALGLVKFHLVLPFVFVLLIRRRWRAIRGFFSVAAGFVAVCVAVTGWRFLIDYPRLLLRLPSVPDAGTHLSGMANLRGLIVGFAHWDPPVAAMALISLALLIWSARAWNQTERGFAIAMVVTVLASHHLNPHDLSILLIPAAVAIRNTPLRSWRTALLASLLAPVSLMLLGKNFWLTGISVVALLIVLAVPPAESIQFRESG